jgi:hypothetical protein
LERAINVLPPPFAAGPVRVLRFQREASLWPLSIIRTSRGIYDF